MFSEIALTYFLQHKVDEQRYLLFPMITILYKYGLGN